MLGTSIPKKIIKALYDYTAQGPGELSFKTGDFLYVVGGEDDPEWFEAFDPPTNAKGMVPVSYFDVVNRGAPSTVPLPKGEHVPEGQHGHQHSTSTGSTPTSRSSQGRSQLYGVVLYDFVAERQDELQASAGESIIIIAQSTDEWFVAKPIGRLGGPGLIPVSFIEIRDLATNQPVENVDEAIKKAGVPQVEEWKRQAAEYKASSIPLGKLDDGRSSGGYDSVYGGDRSRVSNSHTSKTNSAYSHRNSTQVFVRSASVDRYAFDGGRYWYLVVAELSNGRYRNLCRYYQDFYDFQIRLLDEFPDEAGRTGRQRILPFMPGPLTYVNDSISSQRRANLDEYVRTLISMPPYISRSPIVQQLFALRTGDIETPHLTNTMPQPQYREERHSQSHNDAPQRMSRTQISQQQLQQGHQANRSTDSTDFGAAAGVAAGAGAAGAAIGAGAAAAASAAGGSVGNDPNSLHTHSASASTSSQQGRSPSPRSQVNRNSRDSATQTYGRLSHRFSNNQASQHHQRPSHDSHVSSHRSQYQSYTSESSFGQSHVSSMVSGVDSPTLDSQAFPPHYDNSANANTPTDFGSAEADNTISDVPDGERSSINGDDQSSLTVPPGLVQSSHARQHSQSTVTASHSNGGIASSHQSKPSDASLKDGSSFIKVKVFHEDDLIAIRIPTNATFDVVSSRICQRLGVENVVLMFKDEAAGGQLDEISNDEEFRMALGDKNKLVLYAQ